jgi:acyl-CoA synthetase (AMP-forming)/AMP-acid ligase II
VFMRRPDAATLLVTVAQERITCFMVTPTSIHALLERADVGAADLSSLKYLIFGAAPMPPALLKRALERFGPVLMQLYAQSEASTMLTAMLPDDYAQVLKQPQLGHRLASVGRPTHFARIAIMDDAGRLLPAGEDGEIVARSAMVMQGYLGDPDGTEATRAHGWHHTGDVGHLDDDGFLYVVDRKRDLIISGGFNVFPSEVENFILEQEGVKECAVVGVKDERWGEAVKAVIVAEEGASLDLAGLESACRAHLGGVKCPKSFDVWPELPRSHLGKVLKRTIRERYE